MAATIAGSGTIMFTVVGDDASVGTQATSVMVAPGTSGVPIAGNQSPTPAGKKLIQYGWDRPDPYTLGEYLQSMAGLPFDGVILNLRDYTLGFDPKPWPESELVSQGDLLAKTSMGSFTDNFIIVHLFSSKELGRGMDWFDDSQWQVIASNVSLLSQVAARWNSAGVCLDFEPYGNSPWLYAWQGNQPSRTFPETVEKVRLRGQQFMDALQSHSPRLRVFTLFLLSGLQSLFDKGTPQLDTDLPRQQYALLPAFVNGMLDRLGPESLIVDGTETAYYYTAAGEFSNAADYIRQKAQILVAPENMEKYRTQVQVGSAIYLDYLMGLGPVTGHPDLSSYLSGQDRCSGYLTMFTGP